MGSIFIISIFNQLILFYFKEVMGDSNFLPATNSKYFNPSSNFFTKCPSNCRIEMVFIYF